MKTSDGFILLANAVTTVTGSAFSTSKFRTFTINYTLGAAIDTGSITFTWQYRDAAGNWKPIWSVTVGSSGPDISMPIVQPNTCVHTSRAVVSAHTAVDSEAAAVPITITMEAGS